MDRLQYELFSLRKFIVGKDETPLLQALGDPLVVRHMASAGITFKDCEQIVSDSIKHWQSHGIGSWAVVVGDKIEGWAGFKEWKNGEYEILIVLSPKQWGLGRHIFSALRELAFAQFKLTSIFILLPESRKTYKFMDRSGFAFAGKETFNNKPFKKFVMKPEFSLPER